MENLILEHRKRVAENIEKSFNGDLDIEKAKHNVGDVDPTNPNYLWTEYKPGKFDWRKKDGKHKGVEGASTNPFDKQQPSQKTDDNSKNKNDVKIDKELKKKIDYQFHIYQVKLDKLSDDDPKWEAKMINAEKFFVAAVGEMINDKKIDKKTYEKIRSEKDNEFITPTFDDLMKKYKNLDAVEKEVHRQSW